MSSIKKINIWSERLNCAISLKSSSDLSVNRCLLLHFKFGHYDCSAVDLLVFNRYFNFHSARHLGCSVSCIQSE